MISDSCDSPTIPKPCLDKDPKKNRRNPKRDDLKRQEVV